MGFSTKKSKGPISEINVTPFVDVVLVLLIIFMITAPLMYNGINLDLPKTKKVHRIGLTSDQVILSINKNGDFFVGERKYQKEELAEHLKKLLVRATNKVLYLRADYSLNYGKVAQIMAHLNVSGISQIALVTEAEKEK